MSTSLSGFSMVLRAKEPWRKLPAMSPALVSSSRMALCRFCAVRRTNGSRLRFSSSLANELSTVRFMRASLRLRERCRAGEALGWRPSP